MMCLVESRRFWFGQLLVEDEEGKGVRKGRRFTVVLYWNDRIVVSVEPVFIINKKYAVVDVAEKEKRFSFTVKGISSFLRRLGRRAELGWVSFFGFEMLYVYDAKEGYGYGLNLRHPSLSGWVKTPF